LTPRAASRTFDQAAQNCVGSLYHHQLWYAVFAIWASRLALSPVGLRHHQSGPLEWLSRRLTHRSTGPMQRPRSVALSAPLSQQAARPDGLYGEPGRDLALHGALPPLLPLVRCGAAEGPQ
jgi:hypothetical protein